MLAIRGTEDLADIFEDVNRIGVQGYAGDQAVSLYRYYRKLTTPAGQAVNYSASEVDLLSSMRLGLPARIHFSSLQESVFRTLLGRDVGLAPLAGAGASVIPQGAPLTVTGHSLGGHLALLFGRLFPGVTDHVYTYNAPGISPIGALDLWRLGVARIDASRVTNVASAMGREAISLVWSKPGELVGIGTEPGSLLYQHSIVPLTDALALYGAFATLSPGLASDAAAIGRIVAAASSRPEDSLELALDMLRKTLGIQAGPTRIAATLADLAQREDYYANLHGLLDSRTGGLDYGIVPLAGSTAHEIAALAASEESVRFALRELAPFAVTRADYSGFADSHSAEWRGARAELLATLNGMNEVDLPFAVSEAPRNELFDDRSSGRRIALLRASDAILARQFLDPAGAERLERFLQELSYGRTTVFGADAGPGEAIAGGQGDDRLFGASGADRLEGAAGGDFLDGGEGNDELSGGAGNDALQGGAGSDRLEGGEGIDAYLLPAELDSDTIVDRDGTVIAGSTQLTGGSGAPGGPYLSSDGRFSYAFGADLDAAGTLVVNGLLRVEGFRNGDLGIHLEAGADPHGMTVPAVETTLFGDFDYSPGTGGAAQNGLDAFGNPDPRVHNAPAPGRPDMDWEFPGTPGNTRFVLGGGDDLARDAYGGNDWFDLGSGDDSALGGSGNDLLEGGEGRDILGGGRGDDTLLAGSAAGIDADLDEDAAALRANGGDLLSGGAGDDLLAGNAEANLIEGGAGRDRIFGGAGDDWIGGDIDVLWRTEDPGIFSRLAGDAFGSLSTARIGSASIQALFIDRAAGDADRIDAGPGNDLVAAGGGDDVIFGGAGDDAIDTGEGADTVFGGTGNDSIRADWDAIGDYVDAGGGNDFVLGGAGDDVLIGGDGDDRLGSFGGSDILMGGDGRDFLGAVAGSAVLDGGAGDDLLGASVLPDGITRVRIGRGSGADILEAHGGTLVVEVVGDVSPQEVSVASVERMMQASEGEEGELAAATGILISLGTEGDSLFLADVFPGTQPAATRIEFADGTVWDDATLRSLLAPADGLPGEEGGDVYLFAPGDATGSIEDFDSTPGNTDVLRFASGIEPESVGVFATGTDFILTAGPGSVRLRGGRTPEGAIERIEFAGGTAWSAADLEARAEILPGNRAPELPSSLGRFAAEPGALVEIALPGDAISDPDRFDSVGLYAVSADGERLPDWLHFDAAARAFSGTPAAADAGEHELLVIAADTNGAAAIGSLTIAVSGDEAIAQQAASPTARAPSASERTVTDGPVLNGVPAPAPMQREDIVLASAAPPQPAGDVPRVGVPADALFRDMQQRFDVLLQTGRANLGERYADAIREFEERRSRREEAPLPPPPTEEEVEAWNSAMHAWHERNPGFAETELGGNDGTWSMGWGLPGPGERAPGGNGVNGTLGLENPNALPRLGGTAPSPALGEGLRTLR